VVVTNAVTSRLKAPRTAVYEGPERLAIEEKNSVIRVSGFVDSQNSFGALIRTVFAVEIGNEGVLSVHFPVEEEEMKPAGN
jgi:hypothetical protein